MSWDAAYRVSPDMARISQVTMLKSRFSSTSTIESRVRPLAPVFGNGDELGIAVHLHCAITARAMTGRSGCANFAPIAYGTAAPIEASPPERLAIIPSRNFRFRANQLATSSRVRSQNDAVG